MDNIDLLVENSSFLLTMRGGRTPRSGKDLGDNGEIKNGAIAVSNGIIIETGTTEEISRKYKNPKNLINARGHLVMPGFVDCHTHLVFGGSRENEMRMRLNGASYLDILKAGGGIHSSVRETRKIEEEELFQVSKKRVLRMLAHGTGTIEIKSGYGLDKETEDKILRVADRIDRELPADIVKTFLGAHTIPENTDRNTYISWLKTGALEYFRDKAGFFDIFCEDGAFSPEETFSILKAAKNAGFRLKIHAGQFSDSGIVGLVASSIGCLSADHLDIISDDQLKIMEKEKIIAVFLPGASFYLGMDKFPDVNRFKNIPIALATDFNPGSCPSFSMQMMVSLACLKMKMSPEEALSASTINAAWAVGKGLETGSLEAGKKADILIMDVKNSAEIPYYFGCNLVRTLIKDGNVLRLGSGES